MAKRVITNSYNDNNSNDKDNSQKESLDNLKRAQQRKLRKFRTASCLTPGGGGILGNSDVIGLAPEYFVPQLENSSLELPRYRQEIVSWCDYYYQTNELIAAAIDTHATLSVADFAISCKDKKIQQEYEDMLDDLDYTELLSDIAYEFFRLGNAFPMGDYDEDNKAWKEFVVMPMLNIDLQKSLFSKDPKIYLVPDDTLKKMSMTQDPRIREEFELLPPEVKEKVLQNIPILLDSSRVSHISTRSIAGTLWGPPPMFRCFKTMVYNDKIFRCQEAIADRQILPLKIISLITPDGLPVSPEEEEDFRNQLIEADFDPNYFIISSGTVKDNYIGSAGKIIPMNSEMDMIERKIASGMRINKALLHGEGPTYANAQVYQSTMNFYYQSFRNKLKRWLIRKVFKPIAEARGYYSKIDTENSELSLDEKSKHLILPEIFFRGSGLIDQQTVGILQQLNQSKKISDDTFIKMVIPDIDPEEERIKIMRQESQNLVLKEVSPDLAEEIQTPTAKDVEDAMSDEKIQVEEQKIQKMPKPTDSDKLTNPGRDKNI